MRSSPWSSYQVAPAVCLVVVVLATYARVYDHAWLFDDEFLILKNRYLDAFANLGRIFTSSSTAGAGFHDAFYRPLQGAVYLLVNQTFGRAPWAFHALNVGLHAINAVLIWRLGVGLGLGAAASFPAALWWAVHPLHVEAVTYASATADPLHATGVLIALNLLVPRITRARLAGAVLAFVVALLSKESAIVVPALVMVVLFLTRPGRWTLRCYRVTLPFWAAAAVYWGLRRISSTPTTFFTKPDAYADHVLVRLWTSLATIPAYLELIVWPHDLHMDRDFPPVTSLDSGAALVGLALVLTGLGVMLWAARRRTPGSICAAGLIAWIFAAHAPHSGILIAVNSVFLEHWMYLTALPAFFGAGLLLARSLGPRARVTVTAAVAVALAQKTWRQNEVWATPLRFFTHTLAYSPTSGRIRHNLANALLDAGRTEEGLAQFELMIAAHTPYAATYHTAAHVYFFQHRLDRAEAYYLEALHLDPQFYPSAQELAALYRAKGDVTNAERFERLYQALRP